MEPVSKTGVPFAGTAGSNPALSVFLGGRLGPIVRYLILPLALVVVQFFRSGLANPVRAVQGYAIGYCIGGSWSYQAFAVFHSFRR